MWVLVIFYLDFKENLIFQGVLLGLWCADVGVRDGMC